MTTISKYKIRTMSTKDILDLVRTYEPKIKNGYDNDITMKGKHVGDIIIEHSSLAAYYDQLKSELASISDYVKILLEARAGEITKMLKEHSKYDYGPTAVDKFINADLDYIDLKVLFLEVKEIYNKAYYLCKQFEQRSYLISNMVSVLEHQLSDRILTLEYNE